MTSASLTLSVERCSYITISETIMDQSHPLLLYGWIMKYEVDPPEFSQYGTIYQSIPNAVCVCSDLQDVVRSMYKVNL